MTLQEKIDKHLKEAMRQKKASVVSVLRLIKNALHNQMIAEKKKKLTDQEILAVLTSQAKKRKESMEAFEKGGRHDLVTKEGEELKIITTYLPEQLSAEAIKKVVQEVISQMGDEKSYGQVMGQVMGRVKGQADGQVVAQVVKEAIGR